MNQRQKEIIIVDMKFIMNFLGLDTILIFSLLRIELGVSDLS